jgi:hypothetical protein
VELIAKHAGSYALEAQKTKWVVELVTKVVLEGKTDADDREAQIVSGAVAARACERACLGMPPPAEAQRTALA